LRLYIEEGADIAKEIYFALVLIIVRPHRQNDQAHKANVAIARPAPLTMQPLTASTTPFATQSQRWFIQAAVLSTPPKL
jgi:hypothetical protein